MSGGHLHMLGVSHHTAPIEVRERLALSPTDPAALYRGLERIDPLREFAVLSTCNRVEIYAVSPDKTIRPRLEAFVSEFHRFDPEILGRYRTWEENEAVVRHLFEVSSGIDSMVVGETEILGQVKDAYRTARRHASLGPVLNRVFQKSFQAAKWTRTHTGIGRGQVSIGSVAVDLALKIFGSLERTRILILGAGEIAERTIGNLKSRGARRITVSNRTFERAGELANRLEGVALPFERIHDALADFDIVIGSTAATDPIVGKKETERFMKKRPLQPLFLIDLAVPRDFDSTIGEMENVFLYNIDDLSELAAANRAARESEIDRCREVLSAKARHLWKHLHPPD